MKRYIFSTIIIVLVISGTVPANTNSIRSTKEVGIDTLKKDGIDPVCKMKVKAGNTKTHVQDKIIYGFCSDACKKMFV
jgi:YHS domain-containing protein